MGILSCDASLKYAKELTITAIEHSMIKVDNEPEKTAQNVFDFYHTLYKEFSTMEK